MNNLEQELSDYVDRREGSWSPTTSRTVYFKLRTCLDLGLDPHRLYHKLLRRSYSPYTIKTYFILARSFEEEVLGTHSFKVWMSGNRLRFKNVYKKKTRKVNDIEYQGFLKNASTDHLYNFLILTGRGGLRKMEALSAKWSDINGDRLEIRDGKGGKQRFVPFDKSWLRSSSNGYDLILPVTFNAQYSFKKAGVNATPHDFRSYYAEKIVNNGGMSIEDARDLLGHSDINTTAQYLRASQEKQQKAVMEMFKDGNA